MSNTETTSGMDYLTDLGYSHRVLSHNSMHHGVPQSRDRIYVVLWRNGLRPDLELELDAWCTRCDGWVKVRQAFKHGRSVGRHGQQYVWSCVECRHTCEPATEPAQRRHPAGHDMDHGPTPTSNGGMT